jgi:hypothetical protein
MVSSIPQTAPEFCSCQVPDDNASQKHWYKENNLAIHHFPRSSITTSDIDPGMLANWR